MAISLIRLKNLFKLYEPIRSRDFIKTLEEMTAGKGNAVKERQALLTIAEVYTKLPELYDTFEDIVKQMLGDIEDVEPKKMVTEFRLISSLFKKKNSVGLSCWGEMERMLPLMLAEAIALRPFRAGKSIRECMETADEMLLEYLFEDEVKHLSLSEEDARLVGHAAALFLSASYSVDKDDIKNPKAVLEKVLEDEGAADFVALNEYQGTKWYNKEKMQLLILITTLSLAVRFDKKGFDEDIFLKELLEREIKAEYKLDNLLK